MKIADLIPISVISIVLEQCKTIETKETTLLEVRLVFSCKQKCSAYQKSVNFQIYSELDINF